MTVHTAMDTRICFFRRGVLSFCVPALLQETHSKNKTEKHNFVQRYIKQQKHMFKLSSETCLQQFSEVERPIGLLAL